MPGARERPAGLVYRRDLVDAGGERDLLAALGDLPLQEVRMHGQVAQTLITRCRPAPHSAGAGPAMI
jgi:hypothetical protein